MTWGRHRMGDSGSDLPPATAISDGCCIRLMKSQPGVAGRCDSRTGPGRAAACTAVCLNGEKQNSEPGGGAVRVLAVLHHPTSMPACTMGLGASHPPVGSQCWNTGRQQSLIPPCTPALLGCPHSPHPISTPVEDMHSTTAALREHPQQPPVSCSHFSQPLCGMWGSSGTPGPAIASGCAPPPLQGLLQPEGCSGIPHTADIHTSWGRERQDAAHAETPHPLHGIPAASIRASASPSSALQNHPKSTAVLLQPIGTKLCPTQQHIPKWDDGMGFGGGDTRRPGGSCQCSHALPA